MCANHLSIGKHNIFLTHLTIQYGILVTNNFHLIAMWNRILEYIVRKGLINYLKDLYSREKKDNARVIKSW